MDQVSNLHQSPPRLRTTRSCRWSGRHCDRDAGQNVDVHQGIEDTITILGNRLKQSIEVVRVFDQELPRIMAPGSELNQVWMNLLDNSIDALGNKGTIIISTRQEDGNIVVEIADNGSGIPQEIQ